MNEIDKQDLCSKLAKKVIEIADNILSSNKIDVNFSSNGDIRLMSGGQKWIIVSNKEAYQNRLAIDRKRPSNVSSFIEVNKSYYKLSNQNVIYVGLKNSEWKFLNKYISDTQKGSIKFDDKVEL